MNYARVCLDLILSSQLESFDFINYKTFNQLEGWVPMSSYRWIVPVVWLA